MVPVLARGPFRPLPPLLLPENPTCHWQCLRPRWQFKSLCARIFWRFTARVFPSWRWCAFASVCWPNGRHLLAWPGIVFGHCLGPGAKREKEAFAADVFWIITRPVYGLTMSWRAFGHSALDLPTQKILRNRGKWRFSEVHKEKWESKMIVLSFKMW